MNINAVKLVYFSPTQTTKRIIEGIAQGIRIDTVEQIDLTPPTLSDCLKALTRFFLTVSDKEPASTPIEARQPWSIC